MNQIVLIYAIVTTGSVLIVAHLTRMSRIGMLHRTVREAISRDSSAVPALLEALEAAVGEGPGHDDRTGTVLIALGLALMLFGMVNADNTVGGAGLFPALVGAALLIRHHLIKRRSQRDYIAPESHE